MNETRKVEAVPAPDDVSARFAKDTAHHEMTVLHDEGLYRHLRFRQPNDTDGKKWTGAYWFDLITWPGCLAINGDMGSFLFSRTDDMFTFFRGRKPDPGYWAQKVRAGDGIKRYSEDWFRQLVAEAAGECAEDWPGLTEAVETQILRNGDAYFEEGARQLLDGFQFGATVTACCSCGRVCEGISPGEEVRWETGHRAMAPIGSGAHTVTWQQVEGFRFTDTWEWDLSDYTHQFLWCCHVIPWGISVYDKARTAEAVTAP